MLRSYQPFWKLSFGFSDNICEEYQRRERKLKQNETSATILVAYESKFWVADKLEWLTNFMGTKITFRKVVMIF